MIESLETRWLLALPDIELLGGDDEILSIELSSANDVFTLEYRRSFSAEDFEGVDDFTQLNPTLDYPSGMSLSADSINWRSLLNGPGPDEGEWPYWFGKYDGSAFVIPDGSHLHVGQAGGWEQLNSVHTWGTRTKIRIEGRGGDDLIAIDQSVKKKRIQIFGQDGNDTIIGGSYIDSLAGGEGDDLIASNLRSTRGRARLEGNRGNDTLVGFVFSETLLGGAGDDVIDGGDFQRGYVRAFKPIKVVIRDMTSVDPWFQAAIVDHVDGGAGYDSAMDDGDVVKSIERQIR